MCGAIRVCVRVSVCFGITVAEYRACLRIGLLLLHSRRVL